MNIMSKIKLIALILGLAPITFANTSNCIGSVESQKAIKGYLTLDVQASKSIAFEILKEIYKIKISSKNEVSEITGNAYNLKLTKNIVVLETLYPVSDETKDGYIVTKHSLCEFEEALSNYYNSLIK